MSRLLSGSIEGQQPDPLQNLLQQALMPPQQQQVAIPSMNPAQNQGMDRRKAMWDVLGAIGMGLATGNPGTSAQMFQQMSQQREERKQRDMANNASAQYLKAQKAEHLIPLVQSGQMTMMEAIQLARGKSGYRVLTPDEKKQYGLPVDGSFQIGPDEKISSIGGGGVTVNNQMGDTGDSALRKKLNEKTGEVWSGYNQQGATSGQLIRDLDALDELAKSAPQGPLQGRMAELFPGFSNSADAFNSIVQRVAPSLRTEGSGSTSDIEYQGFLNSLPRLRNAQGGNQIITQVMRQKAQIDIERAQVVQAYQSGQMDAQTAYAKMDELNRRSILTPQMQQMLRGNAASGVAVPQGVEPEVWEVMTPEERALWSR